MEFIDILQINKLEVRTAGCRAVLKIVARFRVAGSNPVASANGYPACSVWGYKDESINGAHDGTYTEETRKDSTSTNMESCPSGLWGTLGKRVLE